MGHARFEATVSLEALLAAAESGAPAGDERSLLLFECGGVVYGVEASSVEAIDEAGVIAPLPYPLESVIGVASVRGSMRLVVRFGPQQSAGRGRLVALSTDRNVAIHADRVLGVVTTRFDDAAGDPIAKERPHRMHIDGLDVTLVDPVAVIAT